MWWSTIGLAAEAPNYPRAWHDRRALVIDDRRVEVWDADWNGPTWRAVVKPKVMTRASVDQTWFIVAPGPDGEAGPVLARRLDGTAERRWAGEHAPALWAIGPTGEVVASRPGELTFYSATGEVQRRVPSTFGVSELRIVPAGVLVHAYSKRGAALYLLPSGREFPPVELVEATTPWWVSADGATVYSWYEDRLYRVTNLAGPRPAVEKRTFPEATWSLDFAGHDEQGLHLIHHPSSHADPAEWWVWGPSTLERRGRVAPAYTVYGDTDGGAAVSAVSEHKRGLVWVDHDGGAIRATAPDDPWRAPDHRDLLITGGLFERHMGKRGYGRAGFQIILTTSSGDLPIPGKGDWGVFLIRKRSAEAANPRIRYKDQFAACGQVKWTDDLDVWTCRLGTAAGGTVQVEGLQGGPWSVSVRDEHADPQAPVSLTTILDRVRPPPPVEIVAPGPRAIAEGERLRELNGGGTVHLLRHTGGVRVHAEEGALVHVTASVPGVSDVSVKMVDEAFREQPCFGEDDELICAFDVSTSGEHTIWVETGAPLGPHALVVRVE